MRFDPSVLAPVTLATSLAGALVLVGTLSQPAYAEGDDGSGAAPAPSAMVEVAPLSAPHGSIAGAIDRDGVASAEPR